MDSTENVLLYYIAYLLPGFFMLAISIIGIVLLKANEAKLHKFFYMFCFMVLAVILVASLFFQGAVIKAVFDSRNKMMEEEEKLSTINIPSVLTSKETIEDYKYEYFLKKDHKAFANSLDGPYGWCTNKVNVEDAKQCALKQCEAVESEKSAACKIISVDGEIEGLN